MVLDRSSSISCGRLTAAKQALIGLLCRLDDRDRFGLVVFDDEAEVAVPAGRLANLGLAQVATITLTHVEVATLEQRHVTLPVTVNLVPQDLARGRAPSPEVTREKLFLAAQIAKRSVEEALLSSDPPTARARLSRVSAVLSHADMDDLGSNSKSRSARWVPRWRCSPQRSLAPLRTSPTRRAG